MTHLPSATSQPPMAPHVAAYRGKSLISLAIRAFNWGPYSHVSWLTARGTEIEAWGKGVTETPGIGLNHSPGTVIDLFAIEPLDHYCRISIDGSMRAAVGLGYDFLGIAGFIFRAPWLQRRDRLFCSELVFSRCQTWGVDLLRRIPPYKVSPSTLAISPRLIKVSTITLPAAGPARTAQQAPTA